MSCTRGLAIPSISGGWSHLVLPLICFLLFFVVSERRHASGMPAFTAGDTPLARRICGHTVECEKQWKSQPTSYLFPLGGTTTRPWWQDESQQRSKRERWFLLDGKAPISCSHLMSMLVMTVVVLWEGGSLRVWRSKNRAAAPNH